MKSRQETTSLGQIATVTAKPTISNKQQAFIYTDMRRFKIQTGDMGPPPPAGPQYSVVLTLFIAVFSVVLLLHYILKYGKHRLVKLSIVIFSLCHSSSTGESKKFRATEY